MAALWNAVWSLIPWGSPTPHAVPQVGEQAPTAPALQGRPGIVAFPRHCGCPFATKEVLVLAQLTREHPDLHVVIVQHSPEEVTKDWFEAIGGRRAFPDGRYTLVADPTRELHAQWGVGTLGWTNMLDRSAFSKIKELQETDKIGVATWYGSYRWQNSGGFAVNSQGNITWVHIASTASDMCDYEAAVKTLTA